MFMSIEVADRMTYLIQQERKRQGLGPFAPVLMPIPIIQEFKIPFKKGGFHYKGTEGET